MDVNVRGLVRATQLVLPDMVARRRGRIINLTSQAGVHRWPLVSAYSVSKAAVIKLTENLAHETSRYGISVFSVHPGLLPIGMTDTVAAHAAANPHEARIQRWAANELREGRGADPERAVDLHPAPRRRRRRPALGTPPVGPRRPRRPPVPSAGDHRPRPLRPPTRTTSHDLEEVLVKSTTQRSVTAPPYYLGRRCRGLARTVLLQGPARSAFRPAASIVLTSMVTGRR